MSQIVKNAPSRDVEESFKNS